MTFLLYFVPAFLTVIVLSNLIDLPAPEAQNAQAFIFLLACAGGFIASMIVDLLRFELRYLKRHLYPVSFETIWSRWRVHHLRMGMPLFGRCYHSLRTDTDTMPWWRPIALRWVRLQVNRPSAGRRLWLYVRKLGGTITFEVYVDRRPRDNDGQIMFERSGPPRARDGRFARLTNGAD